MTFHNKLTKTERKMSDLNFLRNWYAIKGDKIKAYTYQERMNDIRRNKGVFHNVK